MIKKVFLLYVALLNIVIYSGILADIYIKQKNHTDTFEMMGVTQEAQDFIVESWITPEKIAVRNQGKDIIMDMEKKIINMVDHNERTISVMPLNFSEIKNEEDQGISDEEMENFEKFMGEMMKMDFKVEKMQEKKKIGKWNCQKYIQTVDMGMGSVRSVIWATNDIKIDADLYSKYSAGVMSNIPGLSDNIEGIMEEIRKIEGVQVYIDQSTNMMGQSFRTVSELVEFREGKAPASVFKLPNDYRMVNLFDGMR